LLAKKIDPKNPNFFITTNKMLLRSGKTLFPSRYNDLKKRATTVYPLETVKSEQCQLMKSKLNSWNNIIKPQYANELLISIINVPEIIANSLILRSVIQTRLNEIMNHQSFIKSIDKDILRAIKDYFNWLKMRPDYEDEPEVVMKRVNTRTQLIQQELFETLYHPDRYERMTAKYGEIWADIHLPY
jgi:hypothetical protein